MAVKIRLRRVGAKHQPSYRIVVADSRSPRDGRFIDQIGTYNPRTNPATVTLNRDKAIDWLRKGAQPTETVEILLKKASIVPGEVRKGEAPVGAGTYSQGPESTSRTAQEQVAVAQAAPTAAPSSANAETAPVAASEPAAESGAEITLEIEPNEAAALEEGAE